ncbi:MAG: accessory factor UbiK family protein [Sulfurisoma sp.]|nr:accessory factor UbiK family protein [Sulfurisoma sp.]
MLDPKTLEEFSARFSALIKATPAGDIEKNVKAFLASGLGRLNLVTREEFDVQREVLAETRRKLSALEARVGELEAKLGQRG